MLMLIKKTKLDINVMNGVSNMASNILDLINYKFLRIAAKSHTCEMCGCEIHRGEHIWWYKPKPNYFKVNRNRKGFKTYNIWRKRCFNCEPLSYAELDLIMSREATQGGY